jgi:hypothetical protein
MKNLLIVGLALPLVLSAGMTMATSDHTGDRFQTLGQVESIETSAITHMTAADLKAVEGKMRWRGSRGYKSYSYSSNRNSTDQVNLCVLCVAKGRRDGGYIGQFNGNDTVQR